MIGQREEFSTVIERVNRKPDVDGPRWSDASKRAADQVMAIRDTYTALFSAYERKHAMIRDAVALRDNLYRAGKVVPSANVHMTRIDRVRSILVGLIIVAFLISLWWR